MSENKVAGVWIYYTLCGLLYNSTKKGENLYNITGKMLKLLLASGENDCYTVFGRRSVGKSEGLLGKRKAAAEPLKMTAASARIHDKEET